MTRRCRSVSPELSARMPGGRPGSERPGLLSRLVVHRVHRLESVLGAVLGSDGGAVCGRGHVGPSLMFSLLDNGSCFRKVAPNTRSSENWELPDVIKCLGVWLTRQSGGQKGSCSPSPSLPRGVLARCPDPPPGGAAAVRDRGRARRVSGTAAPADLAAVAERGTAARSAPGCARRGVAWHMPIRRDTRAAARMYGSDPHI